MAAVEAVALEFAAVATVIEAEIGRRRRRPAAGRLEPNDGACPAGGRGLDQVDRVGDARDFEHQAPRRPQYTRDHLTERQGERDVGGVGKNGSAGPLIRIVLTY